MDVELLEPYAGRIRGASFFPDEHIARSNGPSFIGIEPSVDHSQLVGVYAIQNYQRVGYGGDSYTMTSRRRHSEDEGKIKRGNPKKGIKRGGRI